MLNQALQFLIDTFFSLFLFALLLRFYLQAMRAPFHNPLSQFVAAVTDFLVRPARRVVPGLWGYDLATLVLAWLTAFVLLLLLNWLSPDGIPFALSTGTTYGVFALLAMFHLVRLSIYIFMGAVLIQAVLSWINPYNPLAPVLNGLTRPLLRPIQKRLPPIGNVDLSPLVVLVLCQLVLMVPLMWLERFAFGLL